METESKPKTKAKAKGGRPRVRNKTFRVYLRGNPNPIVITARNIKRNGTVSVVASGPVTITLENTISHVTQESDI